MKSKRVNEYKYDGLGFPIIIPNVTMVEIDGEWGPKIDVRKIAELAIRKLPYQDEKLSGNQIKFIRTYFDMSLREFAVNVVKESHSAVAKWEKCGVNSTNMDENIEKMLRLYIIDKVLIKTKKQALNFLNSFRRISEIPFYRNPPAPLR